MEWGFHVWVLVSKFGLDRPSRDRPSPGPLLISFFSSLSGGLLVEFWWCLRRPGAQMCAFGCASPAARSGGAAGVSHDSPRAQTCTFEGPGLQKHHQNSTKRTKREGEKNENCGGRKGKKREILGGPAEGGPAEGGSGGGVRRRGLNTPTTHTHTTKTNHNNTKKGLAKNGLAKIGLAKIGKPLTTNL